MAAVHQGTPQLWCQVPELTVIFHEYEGTENLMAIDKQANGSRFKILSKRLTPIT